MKPTLASKLLINPSFSAECLFAESRALLNTEVFAKGGDPQWNEDWPEERVKQSLEEYKELGKFRQGWTLKEVKFNKRSAKMLQLYLKGFSLEKIGLKFKVSKQRVYQILRYFPEYIEGRRI